MSELMEKIQLDISQYADGVPAIVIENTGKILFLDIPDKIIKESANKVSAIYGNYQQTITAEGSGNERHDFEVTITEVES